LGQTAQVPPKYIRRLISIPAVVLFAVVSIVLLPIWLPLVAIVDIVSDPKRMRFCRIGIVLVLLAINEIATILFVTAMWARTGFGWKTRTDAGQVHMQKALHFYALGLVRCTKQALAVRLRVTGLEESVAAGGPLVVFGHHTSLIDSALPVELLASRQFAFRYVIKKTLAYAPAFDLGGHLLKVHYVDRTGKQRDNEVASISALASGMDPNEAVVIFPEGTFFNQKRKARAIERLRTDAPHLVERAERMKHTLPPRAAGPLATLDGAVGVDVLFLAHAGLESFTSIPNIVRNVPLPRPVAIHCWRVPASEIPAEPAQRFDWLFSQFERMDQWVVGQLEQLEQPVISKPPSSKALL
jgi:1-acyl-sn-glycerol-3-phosphate acyltransferase